MKERTMNKLLSSLLAVAAPAAVPFVPNRANHNTTGFYGTCPPDCELPYPTIPEADERLFYPVNPVLRSSPWQHC